MKKFVLILLLCCIINFFPINILAVENSDLIPNAVSGILMDADTGKIYFEKNRNKKVAVASMTKMVAQIIILDKIKSKDISWNDVVTVSKNAADMGGSQIYIAEGEKISVEDLMKGISMASGNDATVAMAEYISGTEDKFVKLMNEKVSSLGLKNTQFKNSTGLDEEGHYSSAYDMAMIARELIVNYPEILRFSSVYEDYLREDTKERFWLVNTNKLVRFYDGADGLKTGHTDAAGYCLAATAKRNGLRLIAVVLGEKNATVRNNETMNLLDYGYANIRVNKLKSMGEVVKKVKLDKADNEIVEIVLKNDLFVAEGVGDKGKKYSFVVNIDSFNLPIVVGDNVGTIDVYFDNKKIKSGYLTVNKDIKSLSFSRLFYKEMIDLVSGIL